MKLNQVTLKQNLRQTEERARNASAAISNRAKRIEDEVGDSLNHEKQTAKQVLTKARAKLHGHVSLT